MRNSIGIALAVAAGCGALVPGCAGDTDETREIIDDLTQAGFPADDITVVGGVVYVGRDAQVSLTAAREMLQSPDTGKEQYRTNNLIRRTVMRICVDGSTFTGVFSRALDRAIENYDELPLGFAMARTPASSCDFTINAVIVPGLVGGFSGFPAGGLPFPTINIGDGLSTFNVNTVEHVITHELGHTVGFRHSDFFDRSISCGIGGNEGDAEVGAVHIPGTPTGATIGGSLMNSCFRTEETGEFTDSDITALKALYPSSRSFVGDGSWTSAGSGSGPKGWYVGDFNGDGKIDIFRYLPGTSGADVFLSTGSSFVSDGSWTSAGSGSGPIGWYVGDFNGDGKADIFRYLPGTSGADVFLSTGSSFVHDGSWTSAGFGSGPNGWYVGDFNGDGKTDIFRYLPGTSGADVFLSTGSSFVHDGSWTLAGSGSGPIGWYVGDFDGDGKTDIFRYFPGGSGADVFLSTGSSFLSFGSWTTAGFGSAPDGWYTGDVNGDGLDDVFRYLPGVSGADVLLANPPG